MGLEWIVFGNDDLVAETLDAREVLQRVIPLRSGSEIQRGEIFGLLAPVFLGLCLLLRIEFASPGTAGSMRLRHQRKRLWRVVSHALEHFFELRRVVMGTDDGFRRWQYSW